VGAQQASGAQPISFCHVGAQSSDPRHDVGHQVSVHPVDDAGFDISDLKQGWNLGVPSTAIDPDHVSHPPVFAVFNDHGHTCFYVQKDRICLGSFDFD